VWHTLNVHNVNASTRFGDTIGRCICWINPCLLAAMPRKLIRFIYACHQDYLQYYPVTNIRVVMLHQSLFFESDWRLQCAKTTYNFMNAFSLHPHTCHWHVSYMYKNWVESVRQELVYLGVPP